MKSTKATEKNGKAGTILTHIAPEKQPFCHAYPLDQYIVATVRCFNLSAWVSHDVRQLKQRHMTRQVCVLHVYSPQQKRSDATDTHTYTQQVIDGSLLGSNVSLYY